MTNTTKYGIMNTERGKGGNKPQEVIKMFWINVTRKEQTTDEATVAQWVANGDEVDVYTWCSFASTFVQARFN